MPVESESAKQCTHTQCLDTSFHRWYAAKRDGLIVYRTEVSDDAVYFDTVKVAVSLIHGIRLQYPVGTLKQENILI